MIGGLGFLNRKSYLSFKPQGQKVGKTPALLYAVTLDPVVA